MFKKFVVDIKENQIITQQYPRYKEAVS
jgi:hypothetical protein